MNSRDRLGKAALVLPIIFMVLAAVVSCSKKNERTNPYEVWCWTLTPTHTLTTVPTPLPNMLILKGEGGAYEGTVSVSKGVVTGYSAPGMAVATTDYQIGYLSFDISALPAMTNIVGVALRLKRSGWHSSTAFMGDLLVDHVSHDTLGAEDLVSGSTDALHAAVGQLDAAAVSNTVTIDSAALQDDIDNARLHSQYRLRFTVQDYGVLGWINFHNGTDINPDYHDALIIYYY